VLSSSYRSSGRPGVPIQAAWLLSLNKHVMLYIHSCYNLILQVENQSLERLSDLLRVPECVGQLRLKRKGDLFCLMVSVHG
jgi:hypothetical protein